MLSHQLSRTGKCIRTMHMCCTRTHDCNKQARVQSEPAGDQPLVGKQIREIVILISGVGTNILSLSPFLGVNMYMIQHDLRIQCIFDHTFVDRLNC